MAIDTMGIGIATFETKSKFKKHKMKCGMDKQKPKTWGEQQLQQFVNKNLNS
jgi:hypothetical protein